MSLYLDSSHAVVIMHYARATMNEKCIVPLTQWNYKSLFTSHRLIVNNYNNNNSNNSSNSNNSYVLTNKGQELFIFNSFLFDLDISFRIQEWIPCCYLRINQINIQN